jgi:signal transduction histidine kinase
MSSKGKKSVTLFIFVAFLTLMLGIFGSIRLYERPGIRAIFEKADGHLQVIQLTPGSMATRSGLEKEDLLLEIDNHPVGDNGDLNFNLDQKKIEEPVDLTLKRGDKTIHLTVPLERKNSWIFLLINFLAGFFLWVIGVFVFLKGPKNQVTRIFLLSTLSLSLALFISWEGFPYGPKVINLILPFIQIMAYTLIPALFLHFSILFSGEEEVPIQPQPLVYSLYLPSLVLILMMEVFYWRSVSANSLMLFRVYKTLFLYFRIYLVAYVLFGLLVLYQTHRKLEFLEDKRKIKWIFWGIIVGTFPFIFLHTLPDVLFGRAVVPEVVNYLFMLLIPVSFAFSILRYQVMDIDVVINRSLVYSILTGFIVGIYLLVVGILGEILHRLTGYQGSLFPVLATLLAALLFTPARNRIKVLVDKTFYRVRYDYRKAIQKFTRQLNLSFTQDELLELILRKIEVLLAVTRALMFLREEESEEFKIAKSYGFSPEEIEEIEKGEESLLLDLIKTTKIQGFRGSCSFKEIQVFPENNLLKKYKIALSIPLAEKENLMGMLLMGKKKSETRFSAEDVELVYLMTQEVTSSLQNVKMRKRLLTEQLEKEKLEELNKLKTKFISNVSHDLKTPLTAIRFSVDNMLQGVCGEISDESRKCLQMIRESTLHFSRMIENLLFLSMSESGKIILNKEVLLLSSVLIEACNMIKPSSEKKGVSLKTEEVKNISVYADKHSLLQILLNLLENAIKFTSSGGEVFVSAKKIEDKKVVEVSVADNGVGISPDNLDKIFERFHKIAPAGTKGEKGLGIGLDIVRNLVHLHGGEIKVESPVRGWGKGARFTFTLPLN